MGGAQFAPRGERQRPARPGAQSAAGADYSVEDVKELLEALAAQHHCWTDAGLKVWPDETKAGGYRFQGTLYHQVPYEQSGTVRRVQLPRCIGELVMDVQGMASPEASEAFSRAYTLCQQAEETP
jgi:hypothetical protein